MRLNKLWAGALALLALTACNKDIEPSQESQTPEAASTRVITADLSVSQNLEEMRMLYNIKTDGSGATAGLAMAERDLKIRIAIKRGDGAPTYQDLDFKKVQGEPRATYTGDITVPTGGSGQYQLSAILLHELGDGGRVFADVDNNNVLYPERVFIRETPELPAKRPKELVLPTGNKVDTNVPYLSKWQPVALNAEGTALAPTAIKLEPQGTLLRFRIKNETNSAYNIAQINFVTSAFSPSGAFTFTEESPYKVGYPRFLRRDFYPPYSYKLPAANQAVPSSSTSPWYYIWAMPTQSEVMETRVDLITTDGAKIQGVFSTNEPLPSGSVPLTLKIKNSGHQAGFGDIGEVSDEWGSTTPRKLALEYVAEKDFNQAGDNFVADDDPNVGRFTWADAVAKFSTAKPISGAPYKYSLPTAAEMRSVFPARYILTSEEGTYIGFGSSKAAYQVSNFRERAVKIGEATKDYYSDFYSPKNSNVCYAIRFKDNTNLNKTAFRYQRFYNSEKKVTHWEVSCRYIGSNSAITMNQVADEAYWTPEEGKVTRVFRNHLFTYTSTGQLSSSTSWWLADEYDPEVAFSFEIGTTGWNRMDHKYGSFPVRPFIRFE